MTGGGDEDDDARALRTLGQAPSALEIKNQRKSPQVRPSDAQVSDKNAAPFRNYGSSMNSLSFGFLATAILILMFLFMAIFEHLFRSRASHTSSPLDDAIRVRQEINASLLLAIHFMKQVVAGMLMPGQLYPTYLAQPAPLPCPREGVHWPSHHQPSFDFP
ncbi:uncharacterized protein LOC122004867 [Zingiber officinale]|uniref:uncharacterized protein LOC122004867 n=1 Tax=Zingiber officinale TaxID=94328 RepID=UPI001C4B5D93|nr:uncharacterized protein LOC122004867 [Zingiber officinale]